MKYFFTNFESKFSSLWTLILSTKKHYMRWIKILENMYLLSVRIFQLFYLRTNDKNLKIIQIQVFFYRVINKIDESSINIFFLQRFFLNRGLVKLLKHWSCIKNQERFFWLVSQAYRFPIESIVRFTCLPDSEISLSAG